MAEYKDIKGFKVQTVSTDPAASMHLQGGTWASGTSLNTARTGGGGAGVQTAVIALVEVTNAPAVATLIMNHMMVLLGQKLMM
jgi:hypothetical protein